MRPGYPELMESVPRVARVVRDEEHRYRDHVRRWLNASSQDEAKIGGGKCPVRRVARSSSMTPTAWRSMSQEEMGSGSADSSSISDEFTAEMEKSSERALRASWKGADKAQIPGRISLDSPQLNSSVAEIRSKRQPPVLRRALNENAEHRNCVLDPPLLFYAEAGGQVGDTGILVSPATGATIAVVENTLQARARCCRAPGKGNRAAGCRRSRIGAVSMSHCAFPLCATTPRRIDARGSTTGSRHAREASR